jgi:hypothetical protein
MTWGDDPAEDAKDGKIGYCRPPKTTRFRKGESGNRAGRPPGRHREVPYAAVLSRKVTIREGGGVERQVTAAEAFLRFLKKSALEGDGAAARAALALIEQARKRHGDGGPRISTIIRTLLAPGSVTPALEALRMARKLDPYRKTARIALEPWLVEAALARLDRKLNPVEQQIIMSATRTPHKVRWPEWWGQPP